jgi:putative ABC transport system permease protein
MFQNYLKIAFRNLLHNRVYSAINIGGVAFSVAAFIFILQYIGFEQGVNRFHAKLPDIYRLLAEEKSEYAEYTNAPLGPTLKTNFAEIQAFCRIMDPGTAKGIVSAQSSKSVAAPVLFRENKAIYADADFFEVFSFPITTGVNQLKLPQTVAISTSAAKKYFNSENAIGKRLVLTNQFGERAYTVCAVFRDMPAQSDLQADLVFSLQTLANPANLNGNEMWASLDGWNASFLQTYLLLKPGTALPNFEPKINAFLHKIRPETSFSLILQPLRYMHLAPTLDAQMPVTGRLSFVYLMGGIALLILLIAGLNYINLSTAGSLKRAKEVGVRKVIGATRAQLISQFLLESLLLNGIGFVSALILVVVLQNPFNRLMEKDLSVLELVTNPIWGLGLLFLFVGMALSGAYVSRILSAFSTAETLKGIFAKSAKGIFLRKTLVVFQFTVSVILIIATLALYRQLSYMQNQDLGMNMTQMLVVKGPELGVDSIRRKGIVAFQNEIAGFSFVKTYCNSGSVPGNFYNYQAAGITRPNPQTGEDKKQYAIAFIDDHYFDTYGIKLASGANFSSAMCAQGAKSAKVILNERAAQQLGFADPQSAIGQKVMNGDAFEVIGVIKDYHHQSLQSLIDPMIFMPAYNGAYFSLSMSGEQMKQQVGQLERVFKKYFVGNPFEYFFADENYNKLYHIEQQNSQLFLIAAALAILISCLGLFGLATFSVEQKTKEIGIRKVLGASVGQIVTLLSKEFMLLVFVALAVATPIAWWAMDRWLQDFAYRIALGWQIFATAGLMALGIALCTVSFLALKAAVANPVKSLRQD